MANGLPDLLPYQDTSLSEVQHLILVKTHLAGYFFDAFLKVSHSSELTITSHPVQNGANLSDHAYEEPVTITMEIMMTDSPIDYGDSDIGADSNSNRTFEGMGSFTRSVGAYQLLRQLQRERRSFSIGTRLESYNTMMVQSISVDDDVESLYGLKAIVTLQQVFIANEKLVKVSNRIQTVEAVTTTVVTPETTGTSSNIYIKSVNDTTSSVTFTLSNGTKKTFQYPKSTDKSGNKQIVLNQIKQFVQKYTSTNAQKYLTSGNIRKFM